MKHYRIQCELGDRNTISVDQLNKILQQVAKNVGMKWLQRLEPAISTGDEKKQIRAFFDSPSRYHMPGSFHENTWKGYVYFDTNHGEEAFSKQELKNIAQNIIFGLQEHFKQPLDVMFIRSEKVN